MWHFGKNKPLEKGPRNIFEMPNPGDTVRLKPGAKDALDAALSRGALVKVQESEFTEKDFYKVDHRYPRDDDGIVYLTLSRVRTHKIQVAGNEHETRVVTPMAERINAELVEIDHRKEAR